MPEPLNACSFPALGAKIRREHWPCFLGQYAARHLHAVVVARVGQKVENAACGARLGVECPKHYMRNTRMHHRHGAHGARLKGDVQRAAHQPVIAQCLAGLPHRHDFGMRRRVVLADVQVPAFAQQAAFAIHHHRPNGDLVMCIARARGQRQRVTYPVEVDCVVWFAICHVLTLLI